MVTSGLMGELEADGQRTGKGRRVKRRREEEERGGRVPAKKACHWKKHDDLNVGIAIGNC